MNTAMAIFKNQNDRLGGEAMNLAKADEAWERFLLRYPDG
jgi:hypothetical protein